MASSRRSPPMRTESQTTMPYMEMTAASVRPPPMLTTKLPRGVETGRPAPMAAASGSGMRWAGRRAPACSAAARAARGSPPGAPAGAGGGDGADDGDGLRTAAHHGAGVAADGDDGVVVVGEGDDGGLGQDDALSAHGDEHV